MKVHNNKKCISKDKKNKNKQDPLFSQVKWLRRLSASKFIAMVVVKFDPLAYST